MKWDSLCSLKTEPGLTYAVPTKRGREPPGECVMAENKNDQGAKNEIKKGMSEAGKDATSKTRKEGGKGASGSDQITKGMSETGSGTATGTSGKGG